MFGDTLIVRETSHLHFFSQVPCYCDYIFQEKPPPMPLFAKQSNLFEGLFKLLNTVSGITGKKLTIN